MRFTAALASIVMKMWDFAWVQLMQKENITWDLYLRYVDDCRLFIPVLNKGWHWNGKSFVFSHSREEEDKVNGLSDEHRTTQEIAAAMSTLVGFLRFTGEDKSMFNRGNLPTLDTALWVEDKQIKFEFFEKPTCGNQVVHKESALPKTCIESTLIQETVRRLKNCSRDVKPEIRSEILSTFANKMINSGHGLIETKKTLVRGAAKYLHLVDCSKRDKEDPEYRPLYLWKEFEESDRQVRKYQARKGWFRKASGKSKNTCVDLDLEERCMPASSSCVRPRERACPAKYGREREKYLQTRIYSCLREPVLLNIALTKCHLARLAHSILNGPVLLNIMISRHCLLELARSTNGPALLNITNK